MAKVTIPEERSIVKQVEEGDFVMLRLPVVMSVSRYFRSFQSSRTTVET